MNGQNSNLHIKGSHKLVRAEDNNSVYKQNKEYTANLKKLKTTQQKELAKKQNTIRQRRNRASKTPEQIFFLNTKHRI